MEKRISPGRLSGSVPVPASKSHTIRALIIASLARGKSRINRPLKSADTLSCIEGCRKIGADILWEGEDLLVSGTGGAVSPEASVIDVGNSGTTLYLMASAAALSSGTIRFTGDEQIQARPIAGLLQALEDLGASALSEKNNGRPPVTIRGPLKGGTTEIQCPTSQYLSSLLLACPLARADTEITVPLLNEQPYVEMTLRWMDEQNIKYINQKFQKFQIPGNQHYSGFSKAVPADFSSAAFFLTAAAVTGSSLFLEGLDMDDSQGDKTVVSMLEEMGCSIDIQSRGIQITGPEQGKLQGRDFDLNATPDALPAMAAAGCYAEGTTRLLNVPQARLKETDRIAVMTRELASMGAVIEELPDGMIIRGRKPLQGRKVSGHSDHRVVMALAVSALAAEGETTITTAEAVDITFPDFFELMEDLRI